MHKGIILTGGGALLHGLPTLLEQALKLSIRVTDDPLTAVVRGTGVILEDLEHFRDLLLSDEDNVSQ